MSKSRRFQVCDEEEQRMATTNTASCDGNETGCDAAYASFGPRPLPELDDLGFEYGEDFLREQAELLRRIEREQQLQQHRRPTSHNRQTERCEPDSTVDAKAFLTLQGVHCPQQSRETLDLGAPSSSLGTGMQVPEEGGGRDRFFWDDAELIREQHRLFEQIQRSAAPLCSSASSTAAAAKCPPCPQGILRKPGPWDLEKAASVPSLASHDPTVATESSYTEASVSLSLSTSWSRSFRVRRDRIGAPPRPHPGDRVTLLPNGRTLRVRGTEYARQAVVDGTALLVRCAGCQGLMQVPASCTAVYCAFCHDVTPLELARSLPASPSDSREDGSAAAALQRQEFEAAEARKLAKIQAAK